MGNYISAPRNLALKATTTEPAHMIMNMVEKMISALSLVLIDRVLCEAGVTGIEPGTAKRVPTSPLGRSRSTVPHLLLALLPEGGDHDLLELGKDLHEVSPLSQMAGTMVLETGSLRVKEASLGRYGGFGVDVS